MYGSLMSRQEHSGTRYLKSIPKLTRNDKWKMLTRDWWTDNYGRTGEGGWKREKAVIQLEAEKGKEERAIRVQSQRRLEVSGRTFR